MFERKRFHASLSLVLLLSAGCSDDDTKDPDPPLEISTTSVPSGTEGEPYSATLAAKGGAGDGYTWSITKGSLPNGLTIAGSGVTTKISGTPTQDGSFGFTVQVTDKKNVKAEKAFTLNIAGKDPLEITTTTLPSGTINIAYTASIAAAHGSGAGYQWSITSGALPPGIQLAANGTPATALSGTPTSGGSFDFTLRVRDSDSESAQQRFTLVIIDTSIPLEITTTSLDPGAEGIAYQVTISANGGSGTGYQWRIASGQVHGGLSIAAAGTPSTTISGTPTEDGSHTFAVEVEDSEGETARRVYTLTISPPPPPLVITTQDLPGGLEGSPYSASITANNGSGTGFTWTVVQGSLPPGITIASSGTPSTTVTGTPQTPGTYSFTVRVEDDALNSAMRGFTIEVDAIILPLQILTSSIPNVAVGELYLAELEAEEGFGDYGWAVTQGSLPPGITVNPLGTPRTQITGIAGTTGSYTATITVFDQNNTTDSHSYTIVVSAPVIPLIIDATSLPDGNNCVPYRAQITASGGSNSGFTWSVVSGTLPPGLILDASGTPATEIHGIPITSAAGDYPFTIELMDSNGGTSTESFMISISPPTGPRQKWMAFVGDVPVNNSYAVHVVDVCNATPGTPIIVSPPGDTSLQATTTEADLRFSPDGSKVGFIGDFATNAVEELYVADLDMLPTVVNARINGPMQSSGDVTDYKFSPDGTKIAYIADQDTDSMNELYLVDISNVASPGIATKLNGPMLSTSDVELLDYHFSPDGTKIAYLADPNTASTNELFVVDISGPVPGAAQRVHGPMPSTSADVDDKFVWTHDSTSIIFFGDISVYNDDEVWIADVTTPTITPVRLNGVLPTNGDVELNDWHLSPDGTRFAYVSDSDTDEIDELFMVDLVNGRPTNRVKLNGPLSSTTEDVGTFKWSADSLKIIYSADAISSVYELFYVDVSGPTPTPAVQISGPMITNGDLLSYSTVPGTGLNFDFTADGTKVIYRADQDTDNVYDLYVVDVSGTVPGQSVRISPTMTTSSDVDRYHLSPSGNGVSMRCDPSASAVDELWWVDLSGATPSPAVRVHAAMVSGGDVQSTASDVQWRVDGSGVFYRADALIDNYYEVWYVDVSSGSPAPAVRINDPLPTDGDIMRLRMQLGQYLFE